FVGDAGKLLNAALAEAGLTRDELLVTNVVNKRPPRDEWGTHDEADIQAGVGALRDYLCVARPHLVVALGAQALYACITGEAPPRSERLLTRALDAACGGSITEVRGYVWHGFAAPVLAAVHPAFILRTWLPWRATLTWDLAKAKRLANGVQTEEVSQGNSVSASAERRESLYC